MHVWKMMGKDETEVNALSIPFSIGIFIPSLLLQSSGKRIIRSSFAFSLKFTSDDSISSIKFYTTNIPVPQRSTVLLEHLSGK